MNRRYSGVVLLVVQLVLVLSIAAKYLYERKTQPAVWVRTVPFDPGQPMRGRYLALQLTVDACGLPRSNEYRGYVYQPATGPRTPTMWEWNTTLKARNGKLVAVLDGNPINPSETQHITHTEDTPCDQALLHSDTDFYIPDTTPLPLTHAPNPTLWVLVTVPRTGPPRPIELAVSDPSGFHPLSVHSAVCARVTRLNFASVSLAVRPSIMTTMPDLSQAETSNATQIQWPERYSPERAAVFAHNEIVIPAPAAIIWRILLRAAEWPTWYPNAHDIHFVSHTGPDLRYRSRFRWNTFGLRITSKVLEFEPERLIAWNGHGIGVGAYHVWLLTPLADGNTRVVTEETQHGWLAALGKRFMPEHLARRHRVWLEQLSRRAQQG